jgi:hypothetical protein
VWQMVHSYLFWCLWKKQNDRNCEDKEMTIEELKAFFFYSLFSWTAAFLTRLVISFHDFLVLFSSSPWSLFLYTPCVLVCALHFLMIFLLLKKKKKIRIKKNPYKLGKK